MKRKPYFYVDESGQDTSGILFVVSVVVIDLEKRDEFADVLTQIESSTGKRRAKWMKAKRAHRLAYLRWVLRNLPSECMLFYGMHHDTRDYLSATVKTIVRVLTFIASDDDRATILIDALSVEDQRRIGAALRQFAARVDVRGVKKEESNEYIRLADAIAGFVRDACEGNFEEFKMLDRALIGGQIHKVNSDQ